MLPDIEKLALCPREKMFVISECVLREAVIHRTIFCAKIIEDEQIAKQLRSVLFTYREKYNVKPVILRKLNIRTYIFEFPDGNWHAVRLDLAELV